METLEFVNEHGETMKLKVNEKNEILMHHSDCNTEFENVFNSEGNFKYVLSHKEKVVVACFMQITMPK